MVLVDSIKWYVSYNLWKFQTDNFISFWHITSAYLKNVISETTAPKFLQWLLYTYKICLHM